MYFNFILIFWVLFYCQAKEEEEARFYLLMADSERRFEDELTKAREVESEEERLSEERGRKETVALVSSEVRLVTQ